MKISSFHPLIADLISVLIFFMMRSFLQTRFDRIVQGEIDLGMAVLFGLFYFGFILGILTIKKFKSPYPLPHFFSIRWVLVIFGIPFAVGVSLAFSHLSYFFGSLSTISFGDIGNNYYLLITPAIYLFFGSLYFMILITSNELSLSSSRWGIAAVTGNDLFMGTVSCYLAVLLGGSAVTPIVILLILAYFFTLPRLFYYYKTRHQVSLYSYVAILLVFSFFL